MRRLLFGLAVVTLWGMAVSQPLFAQQQIETAQTAFRTGRYDDAVGLFRRMVRQDASSVDAARGLVRALSEIGDYDAALEVAERFDRVNSPSAELANSLGEVLYLKGDRDRAEQAFLRASTAASDNLSARYNLAVLHYERGEVEAALEEFDNFIGVQAGDRGDGLRRVVVPVGAAYEALARAKRVADLGVGR